MTTTNTQEDLREAVSLLREVVTQCKAPKGVVIQSIGSGVLVTVGVDRPPIEVGDWVRLRNEEHQVFVVAPAMFDMVDSWGGLVVEIRKPSGHTWRAVEE